MFMKTVLFLLSMMFGAASIGAESSKEHYLFVYFTGNTTTQQQICYALSSNGVDFIPLNGGAPVIASDTIAIMKGVRDPHILRGHDGWFYMVATDMDWTKGKWSNRGIVMMRSRNLLDWEHHTVDFHERFVGGCCKGKCCVGATNYLGSFRAEVHDIFLFTFRKKRTLSARCCLLHLC